jgi:hypothetical protein
LLRKDGMWTRVILHVVPVNCPINGQSDADSKMPKDSQTGAQPRVQTDAQAGAPTDRNAASDEGHEAHARARNQ